MGLIEYGFAGAMIFFIVVAIGVIGIFGLIVTRSSHGGSMKKINSESKFNDHEID